MFENKIGAFSLEKGVPYTTTLLKSCVINHCEAIVLTTKEIARGGVRGVPLDSVFISRAFSVAIGILRIIFRRRVTLIHVSLTSITVLSAERSRQNDKIY